MSRPAPRTIDEYLDDLRSALRGEDPALIQDALYDAEEHLRSEFAENPGTDPSQLLAKIVNSYGAPDEVADIYRDKEAVVQSALRPPRPAPRNSDFGKFFGVAADPRAWAALFYMMFAMPLGIFYFVWAVVGLSISFAFMILIFGLPVAALFLVTVRAIALVEGRIVEVMLGERMPRRPLYAQRGGTFWERLKVMFTDPRTWSTLFYMMLCLPLGILYFTVFVTMLGIGLGFVLNPITYWLFDIGIVNINDHAWIPPVWMQPFVIALGVVILFGLLHVARGVAKLQGGLAKHLLVPA